MLITKQKLQTAAQGPLRPPVPLHWELLLENILPLAQIHLCHLISAVLVREDGLPSEI